MRRPSAAASKLDPKLASSIAPTDTVFIFARDPDGARMPLGGHEAAGARACRASFALNDAMAMAPAARISAAKQIVVEARVSKSGQVAPQRRRPGGHQRDRGARRRATCASSIDRVLP